MLTRIDGLRRALGLACHMFRAGATSFGPPADLRERMRRDLAGQRTPAGPATQEHDAALGRLLPGPPGLSLVSCVAYSRHGGAGAVLAALAFTLPSFVLVVALSVAWIGFGGHAWARAGLAGAVAAVPGVLAASALALARQTAGRDALLWLIASAAEASTMVGAMPGPLAFGAAGLLAWLARGQPRQAGGLSGAWAFPHLGEANAWLAALALPLQAQMAWVFALMGLFAFASGLAVVPLLHSGPLAAYHWINLDQVGYVLAIALLTPASVSMAPTCVGLLAGGPAGAVIAWLGTVLPCCLLVIASARHTAALVIHPGLRRFGEGLAAAVAGAVAGCAILLARSAFSEPFLVLIGLASLALALRFRRLPHALLVVAAALSAIARAALN